MNYRDIIRGVREDRDYTQARIGEVLNKSQQGYSHIESGRAELKIDDLIKLCKFYDLSADYLIGLTSTPRSCKGRHTSTGRAGGCVPFHNCPYSTRFCRSRPSAMPRLLRPAVSSRHFTG